MTKITVYEVVFREGRPSGGVVPLAQSYDRGRAEKLLAHYRNGWEDHWPHLKLPYLKTRTLGDGRF